MERLKNWPLPWSSETQRNYILIILLRFVYFFLKKKKIEETVNFCDFFDFGSSFSIEIFAFSLQFSVERARSGRDLGPPEEKK